MGVGNSIKNESIMLSESAEATGSEDKSKKYRTLQDNLADYPLHPTYKQKIIDDEFDPRNKMEDINLGPDMLDNMYKEYEHSQKMNVTCWVSEDEYKDYMRWWSDYIGKDESHAQNYDDYAQEYSQKFLSDE